jgi:hypothetical protein
MPYRYVKYSITIYPIVAAFTAYLCYRVKWARIALDISKSEWLPEGPPRVYGTGLKHFEEKTAEKTITTLRNMSEAPL